MKWGNSVAMRKETRLLTIVFFLILLMSVLTACQQKIATPTHHQRPQENGALHTYHVKQSDDSWLYYYVLYMSMSGNSHTYYATSPSLVSDYRSLPFTKSPTASLPDDVSKAIDGAKEAVPAQSLTEDTLPTDARADLESMYAEYEHTQNQLDHDNNASENPASSTTEGTPQEAETGTSPSDTSSSSSDTSSSDSGSSSSE